MSPSLFDAAAERRRKSSAPLADRMRPRTFDEFVGQEKLIGPGSPLRVLVERDAVPSMLFWGPPGSGKTSLAKLIATLTKAEFVEISAVMSGVADIRLIVKDAEAREKYHQRKTILFIDEIHRFNKAQQDALLPHVERGTVTLIGATTENPSFEVISALLSRCKVFVLEKLCEEGGRRIVLAALADKERGLGSQPIECPDDVIHELVALADGDARSALNALEMAANAVKHGARNSESGAPEREKLTVEFLREILQRTHIRYDKGGEEHYNIISALHKSMRGAARTRRCIGWGRMLEAGEDPLYVARRLIRFASEDIGLADPNALLQAVSAYQAAHMNGLPECTVNLAQAVVYLAEAPKSNALYEAYQAVAADVRQLPNEAVPLHIRNAPTQLMKDLGYGKGYVYPPNAAKPVQQNYLPERLKDRRYWSRPKSQ